MQCKDLNDCLLATFVLMAPRGGGVDCRGWFHILAVVSTRSTSCFFYERHFLQVIEVIKICVFYINLDLLGCFLFLLIMLTWKLEHYRKKQKDSSKLSDSLVPGY